MCVPRKLQLLPPLSAGSIQNSWVEVSSTTAFKVSAAGVLTTIYSGGAFPQGNKLIQGTVGNLYGIGGANNGSIFKVTPSGALTTVYTFDAASTDGVGPAAGAGH